MREKTPMSIKGFIGFLIFSLSIATGMSSIAAESVDKSCHEIGNNSERLSCYDKIYASDGKTDEKTVIRDEEQGKANDSPWQERAMEISQTRNKWFSLTPYRPSYVLLATYNDSPNEEPFEQFLKPGEEMDKVEAKFQISLQFEAWQNMLDTGSNLYFAYTHTAFWQVYNSEASAPFRESNYEPEIGISFKKEFEILGIKGREIRLGFVHQSNGRAEPLSRSWNRIFALFVLEKDNLAMVFRPWVRIEEDEEDDNNPDIDDFMGNFEWYGFYKTHKHTFGVMLRNNLKSEDNRGAIQLDWSYPLNNRLKFYIQYFNGYGESLIDYNHRSDRVGIGLMLTDWL